MTKVNQSQTLLSITAGSKKELKYRKLPEGLYVIFYEGGGELPAQLQGGYTSVFAVQKAIDAYKSTK